MKFKFYPQYHDNKDENNDLQGGGGLSLAWDLNHVGGPIYVIFTKCLLCQT
jgi:hypothetical protein